MGIACPAPFTLMTDPWPFADPPNVVVFTSRRIVFGDAWIRCASHDEDDGAWQFHPGFTSEKDAAVVGLGTIGRLDPGLREMCDLLLGWVATREAAREARERRLTGSRPLGWNPRRCYAHPHRGEEHQGS